MMMMLMIRQINLEESGFRGVVACAHTVALLGCIYVLSVKLIQTSLIFIQSIIYFTFFVCI